jgi:hypothetical protein
VKESRCRNDHGVNALLREHWRDMRFRRGAGRFAGDLPGALHIDIDNCSDLSTDYPVSKSLDMIGTHETSTHYCNTKLVFHISTS